MHVIICGIYPFFNIWDYIYPIEGIQVVIRNYVYVHAKHDHILMLLGVKYGFVGLCICISHN
jgi:hypothetical protein